MLWNHKPPTATPRVADTLFEFVRASDRRAIACSLIFHGESCGWEARFLDAGELWYSHGGFPSRESAMAWAWQERKAMEG